MRGKAVIPLWDTATAVASTAAITSAAKSQGISAGHAGLLVVLAGSTPSVNIELRVGLTPTETFYSPVDTDGNALDTIYLALTASAWIDFAPIVAPYTKFVITGTASNGSNTTVKAYFIFEEQS